MMKRNTEIPAQFDNRVACFISCLQDDAELASQIVCHRIILGREAEYGQTLQPLSPAVARLLGERRLFSHQALAINHIRAGHSVIVATPTASGKSLVYNLPVYEKYLHDPEATALYIYPLKALAQDQLTAFTRLGEAWPPEARPSAALYDGDSTDWQRRRLRSNPPAVLLTNPEMVHLSLLCHHQSWTTFLANLAFVVVDEAHTFRGIFGSHMAQVFRRLNRICSRYGATPNWIFSSATLGNPSELAWKLAGNSEKPALIEQSGAPQGSRNFIFINPLKSPATCAIDILKRALEAGLRTIVYCQSRKMTELVSMWAAASAGKWKDRIAPYRAGYLPEERREIETRMASGDLMAVVSTSALELGIDIGGLDLCILAGYPGTIMQTLQRGGRVGRAGQESAVVIIGGDDALDQYFMHHPEEFFTRPPEKAIINPYNNVILARHLECAAAELPLEKNEAYLSEPEIQSCLEDLQKKGLVAPSADGTSWHAIRRGAHRNVDLRGSGDKWRIEDETGKIIGTMDGVRAWKETHPGAVYIHQGRSYVIDEIDSGRLRIAARQKNVKWHTRARCSKSTEILEVLGRMALDGCAVLHARLRITEKIGSYETRSNDSRQLISVSPLNVPPLVFETDGMCLVFPESTRKALESRFIHFMGSIHALEHALIGLMPLEVMADRNDFGGISISLHPQLGHAAVFVYDALPGGAGLVASAWQNSPSLLANVRKRVSECECEEGCPSCIHSPKCGAGNRPLSKKGLLDLLDETLDKNHEGAGLAEALEIAPALATPKVEKTISKKSGKQAIKNCVPVTPLSISSPNHNGNDSDYVVFDVETRRGAKEVGGWQNAHRMGVSVAVLYDSRTNSFYTYQEEELGEMFERMASAARVIGFNNLRFDNMVLSPFAAQTLLEDGRQLELARLPNMDLLEKIRRSSGLRISLDNLAEATLGVGKSGNGLHALRWWQQGELDKLAAYCRKDVELTRDIYTFGLKEKYLFYTNKAGSKTRISVDFS